MLFCVRCMSGATLLWQYFVHTLWGVAWRGLQWHVLARLFVCPFFYFMCCTVRAVFCCCTVFVLFGVRSCVELCRGWRHCTLCCGVCCTVVLWCPVVLRVVPCVLLWCYVFAWHDTWHAVLFFLLRCVDADALCCVVWLFRVCGLSCRVVAQFVCAVLCRARCSMLRAASCLVVCCGVLCCVVLSPSYRYAVRCGVVDVMRWDKCGVVFSLDLLYAICRVVPRCAALLCCVANAYIGRQIRVVFLHYVCSVCMFCLLACMDIISRCCVARTRCWKYLCKYVASSAEVHSAIIMHTAMFVWPFAFDMPLYSWLWTTKRFFF